MKNFILTIAILVAFSTGAQAGEPFTITSPQLADGQTVPQAQILNGFGCEGQNIPPAIAWSNPPEGTKSFALTVYDPDAPTGSGWWHWLIFDLPAEARSIDLNSGASSSKDAPRGTLPTGAIESLTDFGRPGFGGPCPPKGDKPHRYIFTLYALKVPSLNLPQDSMPALVGFNLKANALATAEFTAYFGR